MIEKTSANSRKSTLVHPSTVVWYINAGSNVCVDLDKVVNDADSKLTGEGLPEIARFLEFVRDVVEHARISVSEDGFPQITLAFDTYKLRIVGMGGRLKICIDPVESGIPLELTIPTAVLQTPIS